MHPSRTSAATTAAGIDGDRDVSVDPDELPEPMREGRPSVEAADKALVRKPRIGDTRPAPASPPPDGDPAAAAVSDAAVEPEPEGGSRRRRGRGKTLRTERARGQKRRRGAELSADTLEQRRGRERNGKPIGRYLMCVQVRTGMAQVAVLEGRNLIEHYVSRPADDVSQIHGNIYVGKVQNVLPGMEAAFVDIATPKNAVLYRNDVQYDAEDIEEQAERPRIEDILKAKQLIVCQVTKNPIGAKGARLTQEVSLPGRFVVLIPNSKTYGISKRLPDEVRKRLRSILDRVKPEQHGLIVRTAAEHATEEELRADMQLLLDQWNEIEGKAAKMQKAGVALPRAGARRAAHSRGVQLRLPRRRHRRQGAVQRGSRLRGGVQSRAGRPHRVLRPRGRGPVVVRAQPCPRAGPQGARPQGVAAVGRVAHHRAHRGAHSGRRQHRQERRLHRISRRRCSTTTWRRPRRSPSSCGCATSAASSSSTSSTWRSGRTAKRSIETFRNALARDKTRSQVFDISDLGLVEMTRKRIGEGLLTEFSDICPDCEGRGVRVDYSLLD